MRINKIITLFFVLVFSSSSFGQIPIGSWREHLPYHQVIMVAETPTRLYAATPHSLYYYDYLDYSLNRLSKINGLSDVGIAAISYNSNQKTIVVAYSNANIDLIKDDVVFNLSDITRSNIIGAKSINKIKCDGDFAYLSCGFGVTIVDVKRKEIKDTWFVGNLGTYVNVFDLDFFNQNVYLATEKGIFYANRFLPNLANYQVWNQDTATFCNQKQVSDIEAFSGKLFAHIPAGDSSYLYINNGVSWTPITLNNDAKKYSIVNSYNQLVITYSTGNVIVFDTNFNQTRFIFTYNPGYVFPAYASFDRYGDLWIGDNLQGLVWNNGKNVWDCRKQEMMGPKLSDIWKVFGNNDKKVIIGGGLTPWYENLWKHLPISLFADEKWESIDHWNDEALDTLYDFVNGTVDDSNPQSIWLSSWGKGLVHVENNKVTEVFDVYNSPLDSINDGGNGTYIHGVRFDKNHNLWILNNRSSKVLKVKTPTNQWYKFSLSPYSNDAELSEIAIDSNGYKWILLPRKNGLLVYNDQGTLSNSTDDELKLLDINLGTRISSSAINCFAEDLNGDMWVGTDKGIKVFYGTANIFSVANPAPQNILIEQEGFVQNLLEFENVTAIVVDGANRKWIGTSTAGLFLISADGTVELAHYSTSNSPMFSNEITSLSLNNKDGEIFIGSNYGLLSFRIDATIGGDVINKSEVLAFPNPVHADYNGPIAIKGLTTGANIKITNINGSLVFQTIANGGEAIWNGKNFNDEKVSTGVYLVMSSNDDGSQHIVAKILVIK